MLASKFIEILKKCECDDEWREYCYGDDMYEGGSLSKKLLDLGYTVKIEEQFGGEGKGDDYWTVFSVTDVDGGVTFFRVDGYYASYEGPSFDDPYDLVEVRKVPVEKFEWRSGLGR